MTRCKRCEVLMLGTSDDYCVTCQKYLYQWAKLGKGI